MTIYNLGSINIDHVYAMERLPKPGETLAATDLTTGLGGKGANQSIAIARAGGQVVHIGAIGPEGGWTRDALREAGVDTENLREVATPTGHAMITVDRAAENAIVLFPGANREIAEDQIAQALAPAAPGDWLLLQNETNGGAFAARLARDAGLRVAYCAAPFDRQAVAGMLPLTDLLSVNEGEAAALEAALPAEALADVARLVTYGAKGAAHIDGDKWQGVAAFPVTPIDTTGAGDTFLGYFLAAIDTGKHVPEALRLASAAAALQVTRKGAADAIPTRAEVDAFLAQRA